MGVPNRSGKNVPEGAGAEPYQTGNASADDDIAAFFRARDLIRKR